MDEKAAHILAQKFPELSTDRVSQYVTRLKEKIGLSKASAVYSVACRVTPIGPNPLGLQRGRVVKIEGDHYLALGCGFLNLEFANLDRPGILRTIDAEEFARLGDEGFQVLDDEQSQQIIEKSLAD
jgi:hypothetical protein